MAVFIALQWLDLLTTVLGFTLGASELSPVVRSVSHFMSPFLALFLSKVAVVLAMLRISHRTGALRIGTIWYTGIVIWNVFILSILQ